MTDFNPIVKPPVTELRPVVWREPGVPQSAIQMIPVSAETGEILLLHRSPTVRSAPDCWSFPSGMHDIGRSIGTIVRQELAEELNLFDPFEYTPIGTYENIAGDSPERPQFHWVITVVTVRLKNFDGWQNMEPDKHDDVQIIPGHLPFQPDFFDTYKFHPTFEQWGRSAFPTLGRALEIMKEGV